MDCFSFEKNSDFNDDTVTEIFTTLTTETHLLRGKHKRVIYHTIHAVTAQKPIVVLTNVSHIVCSQYTSEKLSFSPEIFILLTETLAGVRLAISNDYNNLVSDVIEVWCRMASLGFASFDRRHRDICSKFTTSLWRQNPPMLNHVIDYISNNVASMNILVLLGSVVVYLRHNSLMSIVEKHKAMVLENLLKNALGTKSSLSPYKLAASSEIMATCGDAEYFRSSVMPTLLRGILRSAEANLTVVNALLAKLPFNLDPCATDLSEPIVKHLFATSSQVREASVQVLITIASRCSEGETVSALCKMVHAQLVGPEGRKASHEARLAALNGLGCLAGHSVKRWNAADRVANTAVNLLIDYVEQETHEATLIYAAKQLSKWLRVMHSSLPDRFYSFVKTSIVNAKMPSTVRCAYLASLDSGLTACVGERLPSALATSLSVAGKRGVGQPNHSPLLSESVCACLVWLRQHLSAGQTKGVGDAATAELHASPLWSLLVGGSSASRPGTARKAWFSEGFMRTAPEYVLEKLASLMELVLAKMYHLIPVDTQRAVCRSLLLLAVHPHYSTVRQPALASLKALLHPVRTDCSLTDATAQRHSWRLTRHLLCELFYCLQETSGSASQPANRLPFEEAMTSNGDDLPRDSGRDPAKRQAVAGETSSVDLHVWTEGIKPVSDQPTGCRSPSTTGTYLTQLITLLTVGPKESATHLDEAGLRQHRETVYLASVFSASHPIVVGSSPQLWERLRYRLGLSDCGETTGVDSRDEHWQQLVDYFTRLSTLDQTHCHAVQRLMRWVPISFGERLFTALHVKLSSTRLLGVTKQDIEIMLTPDTQLYNQELLESLPKYHTSMNIKRESKLYSHDVQMDILADRKRLEESQRQKLLPPLLEQLSKQLTDKQLQTVREELDKEASVRQRVLQLDREARFLSSLLANALAGCLRPDSLNSTGSRCDRRQASRFDASPSSGPLLLAISKPYALLFPRLLASYLLSPYLLRSYAHCVVLLTATPLAPTCSSEERAFADHREAVRLGRLLAWWSLRLLQPVRVFRHRADAEAAASGGGGGQDIQLDVVQAAVKDADEFLTCWSSQAVGEQAGVVLDWCLAKFPTQNPNATLVLSFLCPTFERALILSGWALPLDEEGQTKDGFEQPGWQAIATDEQRKRWAWLSAEHCQKLLTVWLNQLQAQSPCPLEQLTEAVASLKHQLMCYTLPFDKLLRLARQVIDSCLAPRSSDSANRELTAADGDVEGDASTEQPSLGTEADLRADLARPLAQLALDVIRSAVAVFTDLIRQPVVKEKPRLHHLASVVLRALLTGFVAPSAEAREICGRALLSLVENVPGFIDHVAMSPDEESISCPDADTKAAAHPHKPIDDQCEEEAEEVVVGEPSDDLRPPELGNSAGKPEDGVRPPRKKLNKAQRLKQKQANLLARVKEASLPDEQMNKPFTSPAQWPPLTLWQTLQLRIWVARCDVSPEVAVLADDLWNSLKLPAINSADSSKTTDASGGPQLLPPLALAQRLLLETTRPIPVVQLATANAFALCLFNRHSPDEVAIALNRLIQLYRTMLHREPAVRDNIDRIVVPESPDLWRERLGLAKALTRLPEALNPAGGVVVRTLRPGHTAGMEAKHEADETDTVEVVGSDPAGTDALSAEPMLGGKARRAEAVWLLNMYQFLVPDGLNDRDPSVAGEMLQAGLRGIAIYGKTNIQQLLPILEGFLSKAPNVAALDVVRQSTLLLTGSLSQHLAADDPRVVNVFNRLINTLNFPSDVVQQSVQDCIASLVTKLPEDQVSKTIGRLMTSLFGSASYAERSGAAHGIAGIARGLGIMSLKHHGIIDKLLPALTDAKAGKKREGALMAVERLCLGLGRLFEPYVIRLISGLLNAFGDANPNVREAASNTARAVMSKLSAHGVKLILPALLRAIDDQQSWRTKAESVELLATMTHCAPKQLSACLPQIVPRLLEVLVDSQDNVKQAGVRALRQIGNVIRNPEVQALVPLLTSCLQDPLVDKMPCLLALRDTCFIHVLGAPSLALILPVIQRALNERSTEARKIAAQIFGNLPSLSRKEELQPYVSNIIPPLKTCLLDAVPEVRSVAAAAFGALVRGMGESCFNEILPWLISTLTSETSSADRCGAAQGLAEVLGAMGIDRLRTILSELIQTTSDSESRVQAHVRDGYLMLFVYLPAVFQDAFKEFIGPIIPTILKSLSDEAEFLRETALRAAQGIIQMFADSSVELLLPELEKGMGDLNWRIRYASVRLLGDLLYQLSGLSGKGTTKTQDEDDTFGSSEVHQRLIKAMGVERHDRILARLHIARSDPTLIVRQAAVHVWKVVVANSSRTLREIVPVLIQVLLGMLGTSSREQQQLAATALGDVVKKLGERILPELVPLLVAGLNSPHSDQCRGVCSGLNAIIRNCPREQLSNYSDILLAPLRRTLCDRLIEVRRSAARTFDLLYGILGVRALDGVLPDLLGQLDGPGVSEEVQSFALDGVRQLLIVRSKAVMPYLVPKLTHPTVNVKAFSYLASVAGDALTRQLNRILPALLTTVRQLSDGSEAEKDLEHCASVLVCIYDVAGVRFILNELLAGLVVSTGASAADASQGPDHRIACLRLLHAYLEVSGRDGEEEDATGGGGGGLRERDPRQELSKKAGKQQESLSDNEEDEDDYSEEEEEDASSGEESESDASTDFDSDDMEDDLQEAVPDAKETVSRVLKELHPLMLRNVCRLLAIDDRQTLVYTWNCLDSLLRRWSPESVGTQINDLRQGVRGAVSEMNKTSGAGRTSAGHRRDDVSAPSLPGFSDTSLPLVNLVKMYADCTLRGRQEIREASAQALHECIMHASGPALKPCTTKVVGPLIRLMGDRQTSVVRVAVVDALTTLVTKCPQSVGPFVTPLQVTFLKCLADSHRPLRLLAGRALASLAAITPRLDPLLADLTRIPVEAIQARCPTAYWSPVGDTDGATVTRGIAATAALKLADLAAYPDTCLHALRLCLLASSGRASASALQTLSSLLAPLLHLPDDIQLDDQVSVVVDDSDSDEDAEEVDWDGAGLEQSERARRQKSRKARGSSESSAFDTTVVRVTAAACVGACVVSAAGLSSATTTTTDVATSSTGGVGGAMSLLLSRLFPEPSSGKAYISWEFQQSQAVLLLIALKHSPASLVNTATVDSGAVARLEALLDRLFSAPTQEGQHPVICQTALRCVGCLLGYAFGAAELEYNPKPALHLLTKAIKHELTDVRLLATVVANHIAWRASIPIDTNSASPPTAAATCPHWLPDFLTFLVQAGRESPSSVRLGSETALAVLYRIGAAARHKTTYSYSAICKVVAASCGSLNSSLEPVLQRLRKQDWSEVWRQGPPDMDNTLVL